jgi:UDP-galactopyranose mutase
VGAGLAGATIAERLTNERGVKVTVIDERPYVGGSAHDYVDEHGVMVSAHGAHLFHTNAWHVVRYLSKFTGWRPYEHRVLSYVSEINDFVPMPVNRTTVNKLFDLDLETDDDVAEFFAGEQEPLPELGLQTSEDQVVCKIGRRLFDLLYRDYTQKHWARPAGELHAAVAGRLPFRTNDDDRYFTDEFQAQPIGGFTKMVERMLDGAAVFVNTAYDDLDALHGHEFDHVVYTGTIDGFFDHRFGALPYRSVRFEEENFPMEPGEKFRQPAAVVNWPGAEVDFTRTIDYVQMMDPAERPRWSTIHTEYPTADGPPHYPVPTLENWALRRRYMELAREEAPHVTFAGRLGTYKYLTMDGVVAQALKVAANLPIKRTP